MDAPPRWPIHSPLTELLHLRPFDQYMQDWPLEVADATRLTEFCDLYETETLDRDTQFSLMQLIVFSLDDALGTLDEADDIEKRVDVLLRRDFVLNFHTVNYWRCHDDEVDPDPLPENETGFPVTPMMRRIWKDCLKPDYSRWLAWYAPQ